MHDARNCPHAVRIAVVFAVCAFIQSVALGAVSYTAKNLTSQGNSLYAKADYAGALAKYNAALADSPNYDVALNNKGLALIRLIRLDEARAAIKAAIQINGSEKRYYLNLAKACAHSDQLTSAVAHLNTAISLDGNYKEAYFNRGWCWDALGQNTAAVNEYLKALEQDETYTAPKIGIGIVWARRNNTKLATWWLLRAMASSNTNNSDTMINQLARRNLRIARGDENVFWEAESADVLTSGIRCLERQQYTRAVAHFKALKDAEWGWGLPYDYLVRAMTLAQTTDTAAVSSLINTMNFNLESYQLNATPAGSTVGIDYKAEGTSPKNVYLFPGNHYYFAKSGSRLGLADRRDGFSFNLDTSATVDLKKIVTGSSFGNIPNAVQIGVTGSIDLRQLMHVIAACHQRVVVAGDFAGTNIHVEPISGFFGDCESLCTATLTCSSACVGVPGETATFTGSRRAIRILPNTGLESHPEPVELTLNWTSEISSGSARITIDPDLDDDGLIDTLEAAHGCDPFKKDTDQDGIPDGWELNHGLNPIHAHDADADLDGDGVPNYGEWLIGSNNKDARSPECVWVDQAAGSDSGGDGSAGRPFGTIGKAVSVGVTPFAVRIARGSYAEKLTLRSGIALIGAGIDGGTTITASGTDRTITMEDGAAIVLKDVVIAGGQTQTGYGAGISGNNGARLYIHHAAIAGNYTGNSYSNGDGGGISIVGGSLRLVRSVIKSNYAYVFGGGIYAANSDLTLLHSEISGNDSYHYGDGIYINNGSLYARNLTVVKNGGDALDFKNIVPVITNCIFWGNNWGAQGADIRSDHSVYQYVLSNNCIQSGIENGKQGNFKTDPKFVDFTKNDFHLASESPCIDSGIAQGSMLSDLEDMPIPQGGGIERGCYEFNPGLRDHARVIRYLLGLEHNPAGLDANGDSKVDIADAVTNLKKLLPGVAVPLSPAGGATGVSAMPKLSWSAAPYASSYDVYLWTSTETTPTTPVANVTATSYVTPLLKYQYTYKWRIVARNSAAKTPGPASAFTTKAQLLQVQIPNLVNTWTRGTNAAVRYWANLEQAGANYRIELWKAGKKVVTLVASSSNTSGTKTEYFTVPTSLMPGFDYKVRVTSIKLETAGAGVDAWDESNFEFTIN